LPHVPLLQLQLSSEEPSGAPTQHTELDLVLALTQSTARLTLEAAHILTQAQAEVCGMVVNVCVCVGVCVIMCLYACTYRCD
jgi:hypothetical protein